MFKAAAFQTEAYIDSPNKHSLAPSHSAFSAAFGTDKPYFEWLSEPANSRYLDRFRYTVLGVSLFEHPTALNDGKISILCDLSSHLLTFVSCFARSAFPWGSLPTGGLVVDVGGGMGPATLKLVTAFPHLKYLIQDLPPVVAAANDVSSCLDPAPRSHLLTCTYPVLGACGSRSMELQTCARCGAQFLRASTYQGVFSHPFLQVSRYRTSAILFAGCGTGLQNA